mgnify:FL=1
MEPQNNQNRSIRNLALCLLLPLALIFIFFLIYNGGASSNETIPYSEIYAYFKEDKVEKCELNLGTGRTVLLLREQYRTDTDKNGKIDEKDVIVYKVPDVSMFYNDIQDIILENGVEYVPVEANNTWAIISSLLPVVLMVILLVFGWGMMRRSINSMGGGAMNFGRARVKLQSDDKRKTTFADVAGADEEKAELQEIVEFLKSPKKFKELGARVPKGVLLVGPPGTGKTLLARAVAGEAGVPFFSISGSDFVEMYVGVGASRVRDLFDQAKKNTPCIIFIDEIDAVGRQRGAGLGGGHDEREQTLNQLLVEMDGFGVNEGVIMIAATNRPDILDPALMRPGRFDRQIVVSYPDIKGREEILKVHAKGKPLAPDVDLSVIARSTAGFTGADLENLLNEAALLAARKNYHSITMPEIEEATVKVVAGTEKKSHAMTEDDKKITAYHEAGHAVVTYFCPTQDPVHLISIIPRGRAAGFTMSLPVKDKTHMSRRELLEEVNVLLGGRAAEALVLDDICTGASNDIERATEVARQMVTKYGMSDDLGPIMYGSSDSNEVFLGRDFGHTRNYSEEIAAKIDEEINGIIHRGYKKTEEILKAHMDKLHEVAAYLIANEKMDGDVFTRMMQVAPAAPEAVPEA